MNTNNNSNGLWRFLYNSRPKDDELAYRQHYLVNDIHQIKMMSYASMGFMVALTLKDLPNLADQPELMTGIILRTVLIVFGIAMMWSMRSDLTPKAVDIKVMIFSSLTAIVLISVHTLPDITPARMVGVATLFIMAVHIGFPSYARTLLPAVVIAIGGETAILLSVDRAAFEGSRVIVPLVLGFAEYIAILGSAYYLRSRYQTYKAISQIKTLRGMLPICASCKKIRDDQGYYQQVEGYISEHSEVKFSHDICPECTRELYPDINGLGAKGESSDIPEKCDHMPEESSDLEKTAP